MTNKKELRKLYLQKRLELTVSQRLKLDDLMLIQFQQCHPNIPDQILSYQALEHQGEFDPYLMEEYCRFKNPMAKISYPVIHQLDYSMRCVLPDEGGLFQKNRYGIDEPVGGAEIKPADLQMIFVPLLCFDMTGQRVGYGKGYYDRFLKRCPEDCLAIGFSYFEPVQALIDKDPNDVPLDFVVTPETVYEF